MEMKRLLWDFQYLVEQLSEKETLQRLGFWRITARENSLIRDQWASAMEHTFCPQHKLGTDMDAGTAPAVWCTWGSSAMPASTCTHPAGLDIQESSHISRDHSGKIQSELFALLDILAVSFCNSWRFLLFPSFSQTDRKTTQIEIHFKGIHAFTTKQPLFPSARF